MNLAIVDMQGNKVGSVELPESIFEAKVNRGLMHQALVRQLANKRQGTHKTKTRAEVSRTGAKLYRQKGTGGARHGSKRAPIFVGGGVAHGPRPRDYSQKMPRKMRRAALRSALSVKAQNGDIIVLDDVAMDEPKTKAMAAVTETLVGDKSALLLMGERNENVEKSARNLTQIKTLNASYLNIRDLLGHNKILMPLTALEVIKGYLDTDVEPVIEEDA